jgi:hypothetical protein
MRLTEIETGFFNELKNEGGIIVRKRTKIKSETLQMPKKNGKDGGLYHFEIKNGKSLLICLHEIPVN